MLFRGLFSVALGLAFAASLATGGAKAADTYSFMGLAWGSSPDEARAHLEERGFEFGEDVVSGPQRELQMFRWQGVYTDIDRGMRLRAAGRMAGMPVIVQLVFGSNEQLDHVIVGSETWNGTMDHARAIAGLARTLTEMYEERYGYSERSQTYGYIDTAIWRPAADGTRLNLYIRGEEGFMFYPRHDTALRVHFANPAYRTQGAPVTTVISLTTFSNGTSLTERAEQGNLTSEEMEDRLRRMYQMDGAQ